MNLPEVWVPYSTWWGKHIAAWYIDLLPLKICWVSVMYILKKKKNRVVWGLGLSHLNGACDGLVRGGGWGRGESWVAVDVWDSHQYRQDDGLEFQLVNRKQFTCHWLCYRKTLFINIYIYVIFQFKYTESVKHIWWDEWENLR